MVCETTKITGSIPVGKGNLPQQDENKQVKKDKDNGELAKELSGKNTNVNTNNNSNVTVVNVNIGDAMGFVRNNGATGHGETTQTDNTKESPKNPPKTDKKNPFENKKSVTPKKTVTSNSRTNTGNNGQVIIAGDNNHVVIKNGEEVDKTKSAEETKEQKAKKAKENMLRASKENYSAAYADGEQAAEDLIGATNTTEKSRVIRQINALTPEKVMGFLSGYYDNDTVAGVQYGIGSILDQIDNENDSWTNAQWTNSEKTTAFKSIISNTLQYAKAMGLDQHRINMLQGNLDALKAGKEIDTESVDDTVKELITEGRSLSGV